MEGNLLGFDSSVFNINLISAEDNWNVLANSDNVSVPIRNIFIGYSGSAILLENSKRNMWQPLELKCTLSNSTLIVVH